MRRQMSLTPSPVASQMGHRIEDSLHAPGRAEMGMHPFRLRPIMKQGTAAGIPETWTHYPSVEDARAGAKLMYQNDRVLRVMVVIDSSLGSFVGWIER
jgi:pheromone shutdown protein TraB